jgi:hypothetical protein
MNRGDIETFYPAEAGGLESSFCCAYTGNEESSLTDDLDDSQDNQESIEYEGEASQVGAMEETKQLPCFRELVRAKKKELKDQYGKGFIRISACGAKPLDPDFDPTLWDKPCIWDCSKEKNKDKDCCEHNRNQAERRAARRDRIREFFVCKNERPDGWVPGWRREWRKFKRDGGLNTLKENSVRCLFGTPTGNTAINQPPPSETFDSGMSCQDLAAIFGITYKGGTIYGNIWGNKVKTGAQYKQILSNQLQNPNLTPEQIDVIKKYISWYGDGALPIIGANQTPQEIRDEFIRKNCKPICPCPDGTKTAECCATYKPAPYKKPTRNVSSTDPGQMNCAELAKNYNIVAGKSFGTANANAIQSWKGQNCTSEKVMQQIQEADEAAKKEAGKPKRMIIIASIVAIIIIGAAIFYYYKGGKK